MSCCRLLLFMELFFLLFYACITQTRSYLFLLQSYCLHCLLLSDRHRVPVIAFVCVCTLNFPPSVRPTAPYRCSVLILGFSRPGRWEGVTHIYSTYSVYIRSGAHIHPDKQDLRHSGARPVDDSYKIWPGGHSHGLWWQTRGGWDVREDWMREEM